MKNIESNATYNVEHTNGKVVKISGSMLKSIMKDDGGKHVASITKVK